MLLSIVCVALIPLVSAEEIKVLSSSGRFQYFSSGDCTYTLVGEIQNTGSTTIGNVDLTATFYNSKNDVLGSASPTLQLSVLSPGAKSPFYLTLYTPNFIINVTQIDRYDIQVHSAQELSGLQIKPNSLHIVSLHSYTDSEGYKHVSGEIENSGAETSTGTYLIATWYDSSGKVVDMTLANPDSTSKTASPTTIAPGAKASFSINYYVNSQVPSVAGYSVTAQSDNYGLALTDLPESPIPIETSPEPSVPEFPFFIVLSLFGLLLLMAVLVKQKGFLRISFRQALP